MTIFEKISQIHGVSLGEAREMFKTMSFKKYREIMETVVPPSGQTLGGSGKSGGSTSPRAPIPSIKPTTGPTGPDESDDTEVPGAQPWAGGMAPLNPGMSVATGDENNPIPGKVTTVDRQARGAKVMDPKTGRENWVNLDDVRPIQASGTPVSEDLARILKLAGVAEDMSGGGSGSGGVAVSIDGREATEEGLLKDEDTDTSISKSIIGDTKPHQASSKLSANLAASNKPTARRPNNGFDR